MSVSIRQFTLALIPSLYCGIVQAQQAVAADATIGAPPDGPRETKPIPKWLAGQVTIASGYVKSGVFDGWGAGFGLHWFPLAYLGIGTSFDVAQMRMEGEHSQVGSPDDGPYAYKLRSTFFGASIKARYPVWRVRPFLTLEIGHVWSTELEAYRTQCEYSSGSIAASSLGLEFSILRGLGFGIGWRIRSHSVKRTCTDIAGLAHTPLEPLNGFLLSLFYETSP